MFTGFDEKGDALFDTKASAIERAEMLKAWDTDPDVRILVLREWLPPWFGHLVRNTWLEKLAYAEHYAE